MERVTFTSTAPSDATVGGSYDPSVISSEALLVSFFSVTPSVCRIIRPEVFANREVKLEAPGTCTIIASQPDTESEAAEAPEARQSFEVFAAGTANPTEIKTPEVKTPEVQTPEVKTPTSVKNTSKKSKTTKEHGGRVVHKMRGISSRPCGSSRRQAGQVRP